MVKLSRITMRIDTEVLHMLRDLVKAHAIPSTGSFFREGMENKIIEAYNYINRRNKLANILARNSIEENRAYYSKPKDYNEELERMIADEVVDISDLTEDEDIFYFQQMKDRIKSAIKNDTELDKDAKSFFNRN